jgi:hypothetical protein
MSAVLVLLGFWLVGEIPGGAGPWPWRLQLLVILPFVGLAVPYVALRSGLLKREPGTSVQVRLRVRMVELVARRGRLKAIPWSSLDAFGFGQWEGYDLLMLRFRGTWLMKGRRPAVVGFEIGTSGIHQSEVRQILLDRGLPEEPLGAPTI